MTGYNVGQSLLVLKKKLRLLYNPAWGLALPFESNIHSRCAFDVESFSSASEPYSDHATPLRLESTPRAVVTIPDAYAVDDNVLTA